MGNEMISGKFKRAPETTQVLHCNGQLLKRVGAPPRLTVRSCAIPAQKEILLDIKLRAEKMYVFDGDD